MHHLRFAGPTHVLEAFGKRLERGDDDFFTDDEARALAANPRVWMEPVNGPQITPDRPSAHGSRRQWARYANTRGVAITDDMNRDQIIAAVDGNGEPEVREDEGHPDSQEQKEG